MTDVTDEEQKRAVLRRYVLRFVLQGICLVPGFWSAGIAASGVLTAAQLVDDDIPAGNVVSISGPTKVGLRLRLDNGREAVLRNPVVWNRPAQLEMRVGDRIEKLTGLPEYLVNGKPITDGGWMVREILLPVELRVFLGIHLLFGTIFVLRYRRTPVGALVWYDGDPERPRRPRTVAGMVAALVGTWLLACVPFLCFWGCLGGLGNALKDMSR
jgi:hypothetical protein